MKKLTRKELATISTRELAHKYGISEKAIRNLRDAEYLATPVPEVRTFHPQVLPPDNYIVTSDWHVPYHDPKLIQMVLNAAVYHDADVLCIGDMIDFPTISRFDSRDIDSAVGMELSATGDVLHRFATAGVRVHWTKGNHELRFFKALKHQVDMTDLVKMVIGEDAGVTGYDNEDIWVSYGSADSTWLLTHQQEYSKTPMGVARKLFLRHHCNIITAHNHHYGMETAPSGKHKLVEAGGLFDTSKLAYLNVGGATTFPHQANGFWGLINGELKWLS